MSVIFSITLRIESLNGFETSIYPMADEIYELQCHAVIVRVKMIIIIAYCFINKPASNCQLS